MDIVKDFQGYTQAQYLESVRNSITIELLNRVDGTTSEECKIALLKVMKAYLEGKILPRAMHDHIERCNHVGSRR